MNYVRQTSEILPILYSARKNALGMGGRPSDHLESCLQAHPLRLSSGKNHLHLTLLP